MPTLNTNPLIYIIARTEKNEWSIYKMDRKEAEEKGHKIFPTWQSARRYLKNNLAEIRNDLLSRLFVLDKELRHVEKLKESHCQELKIDKEVMFPEEEAA